MGWRLGARFVDLIVVGWLAVFVLVEILGRLLGGDPLGRESASVHLLGLSSTRTAVTLVVLLILYEVIPVVLGGATLGKAMLGLRVIELPDWRRPDFLSATIRAVVLYGPLAVPTIGLLLCAVVVVPALIWPTRRGLHDLAAGTAVVRIGDETRASEPS